MNTHQITEMTLLLANCSELQFHLQNGYNKDSYGQLWKDGWEDECMGRQSHENGGQNMSLGMNQVRSQGV